MSRKYVVVNGASVQCKFAEISNTTDILKVKTQNKHFANDKDADKKLIASTKEIGQTLEKNTFGNCKLQPTGSSYKPCQAVIQQWSGFYKKITLSNQGNILTEESKATCPIGGPECISIANHGQIIEQGKQNAMNVKKHLSNQINPLVNIHKFQNDLVGDDIL